MMATASSPEQARGKIAQVNTRTRSVGTQGVNIVKEVVSSPAKTFNVGGVIIWRSDRGEYLIVVTTAIRTRAIWRAVFPRGFETVSREASRRRRPTDKSYATALSEGPAKSVRYTIAFVAPKLYQLQTLAASPSPMLTKH